MRIAIIQFPGSNCERETMLAVKRAGMEPHEFLWNEDKEKLAEFAGYIIVGGFSYEDRARAGVIAALDPIMHVIKAQSKLGKPILGICNGAQILVEAGLVAGVEDDKLCMVLTDNKRMQNGKVLGTGFYNAWVNMRLSDDYQLNAFTRYLKPQDILHIPVAHGEGRFVIPPALLLEMQTQGLNVFQYCDEHGNIIDEFPVNPNGSMNNIAAVSNKAGNVLAMMPHPERTPNGDPIFQSMRDYIKEGYAQSVAPLNYYPRHAEIKRYQATAERAELIVELIITDNQAISVENALIHAELPAKIKRRVHWEIECDSPAVLEKIITSGVLFNDRKEKRIDVQTVKKQTAQQFLVRAKEDMIGRQKQQMLEDHFNIQGIRAIRHGILWQITADQIQTHTIINSQIIQNPYAHDCYYY
jgi:phosphoribosylformylglycinamidine synthase I